MKIVDPVAAPPRSIDPVFDDVFTIVAFAAAGFVISYVALGALLRRIREPRVATDLDTRRFELELGMVFLIGLFVAGPLAAFALNRFVAPGEPTPPLVAGLLASIGANAIVAIAAVVVARKRGHPIIAGLGFVPGDGRAVPRAFGLGILTIVATLPAFVGAGLLNMSLLQALEIEPYQQSIRHLLADRALLENFVIVGGIGIVAPLLEEVLFRGLLLRALLVAVKPTPAILLSALVFALVHDTPAIVPVFVLGIAFGALYARTRSVAAPWIAHATFNLAQLCFVIPTVD